MPKSDDSQRKQIATLKQMIREAEAALEKMHDTMKALESKTKASKEKKRGT